MVANERAGVGFEKIPKGGNKELNLSEVILHFLFVACLKYFFGAFYRMRDVCVWILLNLLIIMDAERTLAV